MRVYLGVLAASAAISQPALAQEVVIHCTGSMDMTIYNPHGEGGTIGDTQPYEWTIRTDGHSVTETGTMQGKSPETAQGVDLQLSVSGLSYCLAGPHGPDCGTLTQAASRGGTVTSVRSRRSINEGTYSWSWSIMDDQASMKTGVEWLFHGQCDQAGLEQLRQLRESGVSPSSELQSGTGGSSDSGSAKPDAETSDNARSSDNSQESASASDSAGNEDAQREEEERARQAKEEEEQQARAEAEKQRQAEADRQRQEEEQKRAEAEQAAKDREAEEQRKRDLEQQRLADERRRKEEEANRLIDFKEGVVLCSANSSGSEWRCEGPLQVTYAPKKGLDDPVVRSNIGMACGSDRGLRDLGMVDGMKAFGCGFGIHPDANMADYPGNRDVPAKYGIYISDRAVFRCKRTVSAYCTGR